MVISIHSKMHATVSFSLTIFGLFLSLTLGAVSLWEERNRFYREESNRTLGIVFSGFQESMYSRPARYAIIAILLLCAVLIVWKLDSVFSRLFTQFLLAITILQAYILVVSRTLIDLNNSDLVNVFSYGLFYADQTLLLLCFLLSVLNLMYIISRFWKLSFRNAVSRS